MMAMGSAMRLGRRSHFHLRRHQMPPEVTRPASPSCARQPETIIWRNMAACMMLGSYRQLHKNSRLLNWPNMYRTFSTVSKLSQSTAAHGLVGSSRSTSSRTAKNSTLLHDRFGNVSFVVSMTGPGRRARVCRVLSGGRDVLPRVYPPAIPHRAYSNRGSASGFSGDNGAESSGSGGEESGGDGGMPYNEPQMTALTPMMVPDVFPNVPLIAVSRNPVFPRFIKIIEVWLLLPIQSC